MTLKTVLDIVEDAITASTAAAVAQRFADAVERVGASYFQARLYQRPVPRLTSATHWQAGGVLARRAVGGWVGSGGFDFICFEKNPLLEPIRQSLTRYRFSDFAPHDAVFYGDYWEAFSQARIAEGLCATAYGRDRAIASVHVGMPNRDVDPTLADALSIAAGMVVERLMTVVAPVPAPATLLTGRERDAIGLVAEGKTDWEIATILGISDKTARFHVDNARRKLGAVNRSHAVACYIARHGLI